jgi:lantibiotic modifying enzyme
LISPLWLALTFFLWLFAAAATCQESELAHPTETDPLEAALQTAQWIRAQAFEKEGRTVWAANPTDPASVNASLYSGVAGVTLFFLEAHHTTGDPEFLVDARHGADYLIDTIDSEKSFGLYEGLSGTAFTLIEVYKSTDDPAYRDAAAKCVARIKSEAIEQPSGVEWSDTTDIISGSAGAGLFLLYAARELDDAEAQELARKAGMRLIELGQESHGGLTWAMTPSFARQMPNFSHGTAGVAYFLATLYRETGDKQFLDAAMAGSRYLVAIADQSDRGFLVFHHLPDGEQLFYLGYCHGPPGTARLFYQLHRATKDEAWIELMKRSAFSIQRLGLPEKRTDGYWNNVSQCCGTAGIADFFLQMHRIDPDGGYLAFSDALTNDLLNRATIDDAGMRWVQAEHRVQPDLLVAQTGYMQGAAGIGMWLLHRHQRKNGLPRRIALPDSPYSRD